MQRHLSSTSDSVSTWGQRRMLSPKDRRPRRLATVSTQGRGQCARSRDSLQRGRGGENDALAQITITCKMEISAPFVPTFSAARHPSATDAAFSFRLALKPPPSSHLLFWRGVLRMNCERRRPSSLSCARRRYGLRREPGRVGSGSENWICSEQRQEHAAGGLRAG